MMGMMMMMMMRRRRRRRRRMGRMGYDVTMMGEGGDEEDEDVIILDKYVC